MQKIRIYLENKWSFCFDLDDQKTFPISRICPYCKKTPLNSAYCHIIDNLKDAGLLDENYKEICCLCLVLKRFGLEYLRHRLTGFLYSKDSDDLLIQFYHKQMPLGIYPKEKDLPTRIRIRIHDFSKVELF